MWNALAVVGAVDIHLAAAIGAIKQASKVSCFAPAVRVASDIPTDFLHKVKGWLVDDWLMGLFKNRPFVLRHIMAFLVLKMLACFEIDRMPQILTVFKDFYSRRSSPAVHVFEGLVLVHALSKLCKVSGRYRHE